MVHRPIVVHTVAQLRRALDGLDGGAEVKVLDDTGKPKVLTAFVDTDTSLSVGGKRLTAVLVVRG